MRVAQLVLFPIAHSVKNNINEENMKISDSNKIKVLRLLKEEYSGTTTALHYNNHFELLIAVILSAQCTDERVNIITARLFPKYNHPKKIIALGQPALEKAIHDCGLFRTKAKNIILTCELLCEKHSGIVPAEINELMELPGVGRKTANVVLSQLYNIPAIAVDTHVFRVSRRIGLATGDTPLIVENELMTAIPKADWSDAHHWLIWHGRKVCKARKPECDKCVIADYCCEINSADCYGT